MTVADTSIKAYKEHRSSGKISTQAQHILDCMKFGVTYSRRELIAVTGLELSSICGRVNEMLSAGILKEGPQRKCGITHKTITPVERAGLF